MPYEEWNNITTEDINKGIVIVDNAITYTEGVPDFNEYIWVPIPDTSNFKSTAWTVNGSQHSIANDPKTDEEKENKYWDDSTTVEYTNMIDSIQNYKGFYIGRYEASDNGIGIAQSKRNQSVWNYVSQTTAITACTKNTKPNMHLIYGIEWDSALNWLKDNATISSSTAGEPKTITIDDIQTDSRSWGNYRNSTGDAVTEPWKWATLQDTGASEYWKANNIYDLAGNVSEWTQEKYSTGYIAFRGGNCDPNGEHYSSASRGANTENFSYSDLLRVSRQLFCSTGLW